MEDFVPTRVSKLKRDALKDFVSVNYLAPKKSKGNVSEIKNRLHLKDSTDHSERNERERNIDPRKQQELEMKRVRYEVMKFGMSGFEKVKARKAKVALALSLGAKPTKNRRMNYKALKNRKQREKEAEEKDKQVSGLDRSMIKHKTKKPQKKTQNDILGVYGKVDKGVLSKRKG